jgi:hypothetical protein
VALLDSCSYARYLGVSTLHTFKIDITLLSYDIINNHFMQRTFQDLAGYPQMLNIADLRPLRAMLSASMLGDYSMSASSTPSCFLRRTDLLGNTLLITSLLDLHFSSLSFLDHYTGHPVCHDARILLCECIFDAL